MSNEHSSVCMIAPLAIFFFLATAVSAGQVDFNLVRPPMAPAAIVHELAFCSKASSVFLTAANQCDKILCVSADGKYNVYNTEKQAFDWTTSYDPLAQHSSITEQGFLDEGETHYYFYMRNSTSDSYLAILKIADGTVVKYVQMSPDLWYSRKSGSIYKNTFFARKLIGSNTMTYWAEVFDGQLSYWTKNSTQVDSVVVYKDLIFFKGTDKSYWTLRRSDGSQAWTDSHQNPWSILDVNFVTSPSEVILLQSFFELFAVNVTDGTKVLSVLENDFKLCYTGTRFRSYRNPNSPVSGSTDIFGRTAKGGFYRISRTEGVVWNMTAECAADPLTLSTTGMKLWCKQGTNYTLTSYKTDTGEQQWAFGAGTITSSFTLATWGESVFLNTYTPATYKEIAPEGHLAWEGTSSYVFPLRSTPSSCGAKFCYYRSGSNVEIFNRLTGAKIYNITYDSRTEDTSNFTQVRRTQSFSRITAGYGESSTGFVLSYSVVTNLYTRPTAASWWSYHSQLESRTVYTFFTVDGTISNKTIHTNYNNTRSYFGFVAAGGGFFFAENDAHTTSFTMFFVDEASGTETWRHNSVPMIYGDSVQSLSVDQLAGGYQYGVRMWYSYLVLNVSDGAIHEKFNYSRWDTRCEDNDCDRLYWTREEYNVSHGFLTRATRYSKGSDLGDYTDAVQVIFQHGMFLYNVTSMKTLYNVSFDAKISSSSFFGAKPNTGHATIVSGFNGLGSRSKLTALKFWTLTGKLVWNMTQPRLREAENPFVVYTTVSNVTDMVFADRSIISYDSSTGAMRYNKTTALPFRGNTRIMGMYTDEFIIGFSDGEMTQLIRIANLTGETLYNAAATKLYKTYPTPAVPTGQGCDTNPLWQVTNESTVGVTFSAGGFALFCTVSGLPIYEVRSELLKTRYFQNDTWVFWLDSGAMVLAAKASYPPVKSNFGLYLSTYTKKPFFPPNDDSILLMLNTTRLEAVSPSTGVVKWGFDLLSTVGFWVATNPVFSNGRVFVVAYDLLGGSDFRILAFNVATGELMKVFDPWSDRLLCGAHDDKLSSLSLGTAGDNILFSSGSRCVFKIFVNASTTEMTLQSAKFTHDDVPRHIGTIAGTPTHAVTIEEGGPFGPEVVVFTYSPLTAVKKIAYPTASGLYPVNAWLYGKYLLVSFNNTLTSFDLDNNFASTVYTEVSAVYKIRDTMFIRLTDQRLSHVKLAGGVLAFIPLSGIPQNQTVTPCYVVAYDSANDVTIVTNTWWSATTKVFGVQSGVTLLWTKVIAAGTFKGASVPKNATRANVLLMKLDTAVAALDVLTGEEAARMLRVTGKYGLTRNTFYGEVDFNSFASSEVFFTTYPSALKLNTTSSDAVGACAVKEEQGAALTSAALAARQSASAEAEEDTGISDFSNFNGIGLVLAVVAGVLLISLFVCAAKACSGGSSAAATKSAANAPDS